MTRLHPVILLAFLTFHTACCPDAVYELTEAKPAVRLPRDEAPHECGGAEWWYYTGRVFDDEGHGYGVEAVIFHVPSQSAALDEANVWISHFAVLDELSGEFIYAQTAAAAPINANPSGGPGFDLETPLVRMSGSNGQDRVRAMTQGGALAIDLRLEDEHDPVLHGESGYLPFGPHGMSFYYSRPRMSARGSLTIDGRPRAVTGEFWFDRQWGLYLINPWLGWDWFSLRLDDGTRVMLFVFPDDERPVSIGTYVPTTGEPQSLRAEDFVILPTATWTSPHTGIEYPVEWTVRIDSRDLTLSVAAVAPDQEFDARATTLNIYWEGLCTLSGRQDGQPVAGHAYVELANFPR